MGRVRGVTLGLCMAAAALFGFCPARAESPSSELVEGLNRFSIAFYQEVAGVGGNIVVSPFSIESGLSMAYLGAHGETKKEMREVLDYPPFSRLTLAQEFSQLGLVLEERRSSAYYQLYMAHGMWIANDSSLLQDYTSMIELYYGGALWRRDFTDSVAVAGEINEWVSNETNGKIEEIVRPVDISMTTRMFLANALYLKAPWSVPFDSDNTVEADFWTEVGESVKVAMMRRTRGFPYYRGEDFSMVALPYRSVGDGVQLAMLVALPNEGEDLSTWEQGLSLEQIDGAMEGMRMRAVELSLPRFKTATHLFPIRILQQMGLNNPFGFEANFSGIDGSMDLQISSVVHDAMISVDEGGTEAAASSGIVMGYKALPPVEGEVTFEANRPFFYLIVDVHTHQILFIGRVGNPLLERTPL